MGDDFNQAEKYSETNTRQTKDGLELIELLNPPCGSKVLDLGCGTGNITQVLAQRVHPGTVLGIDIDPERLEVAKKCYSADNLNYELAGTDNIPGDNYDLIFCNYVLQWLKDNKSVFGPIASKLKKGGRFAFIILGEVTPEIINQNFGWASEELIKLTMSPVKGLSLADVELLAHENGFEVEHLQSGCYAREYDNVEEFIVVRFLTHGLCTRDMFDEEKIVKFFSPGKIRQYFNTTIAILCKK